MRSINKPGLDLIKSFEGLRLKPYLDSVKIPTIGWGTIQYENGVKVTMQDAPITAERADELLMYEVNEKCKGITSAVKVDINDNEFDALCSFAYNVGVAGATGYTLMKLLKSGSDRSLVADQFLRWNKAGGNIIAGLTRRRQAERSLFLQPMVQSSDEQLPSGPSDDDINEQMKQIEDDIMKN